MRTEEIAQTKYCKIFCERHMIVSTVFREKGSAEESIRTDLYEKVSTEKGRVVLDTWRRQQSRPDDLNRCCPGSERASHEISISAQMQGGGNDQRVAHKSGHSSAM